MRLLTTLLVVSGLCAATAHASNYCSNRVDLALVLAVDVSSSISTEEWEVQQHGYAAAFQNPELLKAITSGPCGRIAVTFMQWSGSLQQDPRVRWFVVSNTESMWGFAQYIQEKERLYSESTSIAGAVRQAMHLLTEGLPYHATYKKIDISGDGTDDGESGARPSERPLPEFNLTLLRKHAVSLGIVINGLPIPEQKNSHGPSYIEPSTDMNAYYEERVIAGPGAFIQPIQGIEDFAEAIYRKLVLEIAWAN